MSKKPRLAVTLGDVNGVGPELVIKALQRNALHDWADILVVGSLEALKAYCAPERLPAFTEIGSLDEWRSEESSTAVYDAGHAAPPVAPGRLDPAAGAAAMEWVRWATQATLNGKIDGIVTCPINKECIQKAGYTYAGHTDFIADLTNAPGWRMCLFTDSMRIVHITGHLSLRDAIAEVKQPRISASIRTGYEALRKMGLEQPRIAVAGLNPHAGEAGRFGNEEQEEIAPAVEECRREGIPCSGPHPPDTLFKRMHDGEFDMIIAMYHDQGHIPLKLIAMDEGVNVTLGIPIVRTSVDHGTAFDIAGKGVAREHSLIAAVRMAARLCGYAPEAAPA